MDRQFGFIHDKLDIKILILFILRRLYAPVSLDALSDLTMCDNGISYFDFTECVAELENTDHIKNDGGMYSITEKGSKNGEIIESSLPYSVRIIAEKRAAEISDRQKRSSLITASHTLKRKNGCDVSLSVSDGVSQLLSLSILVSDEKQASLIEENFKDNAEKLYVKIIDILSDKN